VKTETWSSLKAFIAEDAGKPIVGRLQLARDTDLYHDLDMDPARIAEFIKRWAARFGVDVGGFDLHYHYPAAKLYIGPFFATMAKSPFSASARETLGGRSLTLGMLEEAMKAGRWQA
jgi:hypothetical protein